MEVVKTTPIMEDQKDFIEITIRLKKGGIALHQEGFKLSDSKGVAIDYSTTMPGGFPYIQVMRGPNEGIWMPVSNDTFQEDIVKILEPVEVS